MGEVGKVFEDFLIGHAGGKIGQHIIDGDSHSSNAGFAAAFARFKRDPIAVAHGWLPFDFLFIINNSNFSGDNIVNEGFTQFFELLDLGVDGLDDLVDLGGFGVEVIGDRFLFRNWRESNP